MKIIISDIKWDTTGTTYDECDDEPQLPDQVELDEETLLSIFDGELPDKDDLDGYSDEITEYLSDEYGYCVSGYVIEGL